MNGPSLWLQVGIVLPLAAMAVAVVLWRGWATRAALADAPRRQVRLGLVDVAGALAGMLVGALLAGQVLRAMGLAGDVTDASAATPMDAILKGFIGQMLVFGLACGYVVVRCGLQPGGLRAFGLWRGPAGRVLRVTATGLLVGVPMVIGLTAVLGLILSVLGHPPPVVGHDLLLVLQDLDDPRGMAIFLLTAVVLAPLFEEILFRGLLQTALGHLLGEQWRWATILLCSLLFALNHGGAGVPPHGIAALGLLAVVLGWTYERTGSLWPAILIHAGFNALNIAMVLLLL